MQDIYPKEWMEHTPTHELREFYEKEMCRNLSVEQVEIIESGEPLSPADAKSIKMRGCREVYATLIQRETESAEAKSV